MATSKKGSSGGSKKGGGQAPGSDWVDNWNKPPGPKPRPKPGKK